MSYEQVYAAAHGKGVSKTHPHGVNGTNSLPVVVDSTGRLEHVLVDPDDSYTPFGSTNQLPVQVTNAVSVSITGVSTGGAYQNLSAGVSVSPGADTSAVDISDMKDINILYEDTNTSTFDGIAILVSGNGGTNYNMIYELFPTTSGSIRHAHIAFNASGLDRVKIRNTSASDTYTVVSASVFGGL